MQVEHCAGAPPQGKSVSLAIITDFCICLCACFQIGQKSLVLAICVQRLLLVDRSTQRHCWNWVTCGLVTGLRFQSSSWQHSPLQHPLHTKSCPLAVTMHKSADQS